MPDYATLDAIADAHNPMLGLVWAALLVQALLRRAGPVALARIAAGAVALVVAYGLMAIDTATGLWGRAGLDASTHVAVAVAMITWFAFASRVAGAFTLATFALYVPLMLHQRYHSAGDILTTAFATLALMLPPAWVLRRRLRLPARAAVA
ncbi:hypothetical protein [Lysobacter humi (ex Lee et al. 2017)]